MEKDINELKKLRLEKK